LSFIPPSSKLCSFPLFCIIRYPHYPIVHHTQTHHTTKIHTTHKEIATTTMMKLNTNEDTALSTSNSSSKSHNKLVIKTNSPVSVCLLDPHVCLCLALQ
jgi:hypothetical protein